MGCGINSEVAHVGETFVKRHGINITPGIHFFSSYHHSSFNLSHKNDTVLFKICNDQVFFVFIQQITF